MMVQRDLKNKKQRQRQEGPIRGESPKGNRQITKLGDDQERRQTHKWRKTDMESERVLGQHEEKTVKSWIRTAKKVTIENLLLL